MVCKPGNMYRGKVGGRIWKSVWVSQEPCTLIWELRSWITSGFIDLSIHCKFSRITIKEQQQSIISKPIEKKFWNEKKNLLKKSQLWETKKYNKREIDKKKKRGVMRPRWWHRLFPASLPFTREQLTNWRARRHWENPRTWGEAEAPLYTT